MSFFVLSENYKKLHYFFSVIFLYFDVYLL